MASWSQFEDLPIWQEARSLAKDIYRLTSNGPFVQDFRFCSQIRAASGSIMDNIAEGFEKENNKEFIQFLFVSKGSCGEVRSQLHRAYDIGFLSNEDYTIYIDKVRLMSKSLSNFIHYLKNSGLSGSRNL